MQVHWSEKSSFWKQFLEQWGSEQGSDCHVATSQRRDVPTSRHPNVTTSGQQCRSQQVETSRRLNVATSARDLLLIIKSTNGSEKGGIEKRTNEGTEFQSRVTQTSRKCPRFVLSSIVWIFSDIRIMFLILNIFFFSFIMF